VRDLTASRLGRPNKTADDVTRIDRSAAQQEAGNLTAQAWISLLEGIERSNEL
jgi:hypothetical protein